jgi:hypothetical protein
VTGVAYDTDRQVIVRYGGLPLDSNECDPSTWEWSAAGWQEVASRDDPRPTACDHIKLAYDAERRTTLLVGGGVSQELSDETWAWDGSDWTRVADDGPAPRGHHELVYDDARQRVLLYGGYDGSRVFDDFWSWDGMTWEEIDTTGPGPRSHAGMAPSTDSLLLFGGATGISTFSTLTADTWLLTDGRWRDMRIEGPSPRGSPAVAYDHGRDVWVLYGGFSTEGTELGDTWQFDGSDWRCVDRCSSVTAAITSLLSSPSWMRPES